MPQIVTRTRTRRAPTARVAHPKTTRPEAAKRRPAKRARTTGERIGRTLDAFPDRIDLRDWYYRPSLTGLPATLVNIGRVPEVLDQGEDGACTGFALAAVVQYLQKQRGVARPDASPRMLYEMARRYDEWPGEAYDGSSARGAMKGWVAHGVCRRRTWPARKRGPQHLSPAVAAQARALPGGAYYRVQHRSVRDMHTALADVGILFATLMVHEGWDDPDGPTRRVGRWTLPTIKRKGRADEGHAVALVGYTDEGFIVQNSWGRDWGAGGFALLPYEDYLLHATDVWVAQLGVPVDIDLWRTTRGADSRAGLQRAAASIPLSEIRPYVINIGNNGRLSDTGDYWTTAADVQRLFSTSIPDASKTWARKRVMLYLHGGLNDEAESAERVVAFRDVLLANEIYPLHVMWETGGTETLRHIIHDRVTDADERAAGWLRDFRDHLIEAKDRTFELTVSRPGTALWNEMKENARLASTADAGAMTIVVEEALRSLGTLSAADRETWEIHVVAHSAGSIFAAYALPELAKLRVRFKTMTFLAPAMTVALFRQTMKPAIEAGTCPLPTLFVLSDDGERDDNVGPYGKSLLYLVSNAFEGRRDTPLLGMQRYLQQLDTQAPPPDPEVARMFTDRGTTQSLVVSGAQTTGQALQCRSDTHGGFDNDEWTMNSVLRRVLGTAPTRPFVERDLQF